jgi:tetratricopeptide (TPR) repeat protein
VDSRAVLRAVTPGGHPAITALWLVGLVAAVFAIAAVIQGGGGIAAALAVVSLIAFVTGMAAYRQRLRRFSATLVAVEEALDADDLGRAREVMAPLLARFHTFPLVQEVAADVLYAAGDPLSAASLWERAMKQLGPTRVAPRLVAAYAALNRGGDARRVAALVPNEPLAQLALAWSELVATGGDRERGAALAAELVREVERAPNATVAAMTAAVAAIADAQRGDRAGVTLKLEAMRRAKPTSNDAAFLGYLAGVALRDAGDLDEARREFSDAEGRAPESIGGALARRERANMSDLSRGEHPLRPPN